MKKKDIINFDFNFSNVGRNAKLRVCKDSFFSRKISNNIKIICAHAHGIFFKKGNAVCVFLVHVIRANHNLPYVCKYEGKKILLID